MGFNDAAPFTPSGGNTATTLGAARLQAVEFAAGMVGTALRSSVPIAITVRMEPLGTSGSAPLARRDPETFHRDFAGAPRSGTWYVATLANALAGNDLNVDAPDVRIVFNSDADLRPAGGGRFYYGLDAAVPAGDASFLAVALKELLRGVGLADALDRATGAKLGGFDDAYCLHLVRAGVSPEDFPSMSDAQRRAAMTAGSDVRFAGPNVQSAAAGLDAGADALGRVELHAPAGSQVDPEALQAFRATLSPDVFMEAGTTATSFDLQLALAVLRDVGWSTAACTTVGARSDSVVWVEDSIPRGATVYNDTDGWNWVSANPTPVSGLLAHQSALAAGTHQHYFGGAGVTGLAVAAGDTLFSYVYLDPANPPTEVMLQFNSNGWEHRAYWGANSIPFGTNGTNSRRFVGPLPETGRWVRLEVPAAQVGVEGTTLNGMAFTLYGGRATWDYAGLIPAAGVDAPTPISGTLAHTSAAVPGLHQHYFSLATASLPIVAGDELFAYVYLDPDDPPSEVMLQFRTDNWEHRAYWGANSIAFGTDGTNSRRSMGPLPETGRWVRLAVPAAQVGVEGATLLGMAFALYDGHATWDHAGKTSGVATTVWVDDDIPAGAIVFAENELWKWVGKRP